MAHVHPVYDTDIHFKIDPVTRDITTEDALKNIIQFDHNSERFSFDIPKSVDGHDMEKCDKVRVHYINTDSSNRSKNSGVYEVDDVQPLDDDKLVLTWLVSANATQKVGPLDFLIEFLCTNEAGEIEYAWHTGIFSSIAISTGMNNSPEVVNTYPDILEKWKAEIIASIPGGADWNAQEGEDGYIANKPFGETITAIGDTITWDEDLSGRYVCETTLDGTTVQMVHITDAVITADALSNGGQLIINGINAEFNSYDVFATSDDLCTIVSGGTPVILFTSKDNIIMGEGIVLHKKGVYFVYTPPSCVITSLTVNGANFETTGIKPLDIKYLPESHQFGETIVMGDTLTWDGDMTGRVYAEMEMPVDDEGNTVTAYLVKISDAVPTFEDLQSGGIATAFNGSESMPIEFGDGLDFYYIDMGNVLLDEQMQMPVIAKEDNVDVMGMFTLPEKGVYVMAVPAMGMYVGSFTINNYTGFATTEFKTIDSKYLPTVDIVFNITSETFYQEPTECIFTCNKTFEELQGMSEKELLDARIVWTATDAGTRTEFRPFTASNTEGIGLFFINSIGTAVYMYQLYYTADILTFARVG